MNMIRNNGMIYASMAAALVILGGVTLYSSAVAGEPQKQTASESRPTPFFEVVRLKKGNAEQVANILYAIYRSKDSNSTMRLVPDGSTNSIVVRAPADQFREILEAIGKLDVEAPDASAVRKISVFDLRSVEPDEALQKALRVVIPQNSNNEFALDRARKTVIVSADPATTDSVQTLLSRLETLGTTRPDEDVQVRVIWLLDAQGQPKEEGKAAVGQTPPGDLKDVLPGLVKLGIREPRVHAQLLVNAQPNKRFEVKGMVGSEQVSASGRLNNRAQPPSMDITIDARLGGIHLCHLQTEISAPPGHFVVLGVTPQEQTGSAFVVQMIRQEGKKSR